MQREGFALTPHKEAATMPMNDPCACRGGQALFPVMPPGGYLMQQIVASGRVYLRYERFTLPLCGLCPQARPPLRLVEAYADSCGLRAERSDSSCRGGAALNVRIPLQCVICDSENGRYPATSAIEVRVPLRPCGRGDMNRAQTQVNAQVRLARPCASSCGDVLDAWLDVCVEAYLTACRPIWNGDCPPICPPQIPLYPEPCRRRCGPDIR